MTTSEAEASDKSKCPNCGRRIGVYIPKGGDGSAVRLRAHGGRLSGQCDGSHRLLLPVIP